MKYILSCLLCISILFFTACEEDTTSKKTKIYNPNGDSELALLMRDMFDEGVLIKEDLLKGEAPTLRTEFLKIHSAKPTEEGKNATPEYIAYARAYEDAVKTFQSSTPYQRVDAYQHMINTCIQCHAEICPGPVRKIKKLELSEKELLLVK